MAHVIYNGDFGENPMFSKEFIKKTTEGKKLEIAEEKAKQEQDKTTYEADLNNPNPEIAIKAQKRIDRINARLFNLNDLDSSL